MKICQHDQWFHSRELAATLLAVYFCFQKGYNSIWKYRTTDLALMRRSLIMPLGAHLLRKANSCHHALKIYDLFC